MIINQGDRRGNARASGQITSNFLIQASWRLYEIRQPPTSSHNLQLPHSRHGHHDHLGHHGRHGHGGHGDLAGHVGHGGHGCCGEHGGHSGHGGPGGHVERGGQDRTADIQT